VAPATDPDSLVSSGIPGLDDVLGGGFQREMIEVEGAADVGYAVVRDHQGPLGSLPVEIGDEFRDRGPGGDVRVYRRAAIER